MSDKIPRNRLRGDQTEPIQGPTLTEMALSLNDASFKLGVVRSKCRVSRKMKRTFYYEGGCPECASSVKTESHRCHQEATRLAYEEGMCQNCGTAIINIVPIPQVAAQADASFATA